MNSESGPNLIVTLVPLIALALWIFFMVDCYHNAVPSRKVLWLVLIAFTGIIGWLIFYFSGDREK
jgi:uncharacterized membrane protein